VGRWGPTSERARRGAGDPADKKMSLKDKLEIGLKPDAPYRPDNLPEFQQDDPACREAGMPGTSPKVERARDECDVAPAPRRLTPTKAAPRVVAKAKRTARKKKVSGKKVRSRK